MTWIGELWRQLRYQLSGARFDDGMEPNAASGSPAAVRQCGATSGVEPRRVAVDAARFLAAGAKPPLRATAAC